MKTDINTSRLEDAWYSLETPVFRVLDENGDNVAEAQVRRFDGSWLYVDSVDGYEVLEDVEDLRLEPVDQEDRFVGLDPDLIWGLRGTCPQDYEADLKAPDLTHAERRTLAAIYPVAVNRAVLRYATTHGYSVSRDAELGDIFGDAPEVCDGEEARWHYPTRQAVAAICLWGRRWIVREVQAWQKDAR